MKQVEDPGIDMHVGLLLRRYLFVSYYNCNLMGKLTQAVFFPCKVYVIAAPGLKITISRYNGGST